MSAGMFEDQVVIVTGGGRGIGAAACRLFAEHGAKVVVSDRDEEPTMTNVQAIQDAGGEAIGIPGDVTDAAFPDKLMKYLSIRSATFRTSVSSTTPIT